MYQRTEPMKPTKEQFHGYLGVQADGKTNMFVASAVQYYARTDHGVYLLPEHVAYIISHYDELKEEYGGVE